MSQSTEELRRLLRQMRERLQDLPVPSRDPLPPSETDAAGPRPEPRVVERPERAARVERPAEPAAWPLLAFWGAAGLALLGVLSDLRWLTVLGGAAAAGLGPRLVRRDSGDGEEVVELQRRVHVLENRVSALRLEAGAGGGGASREMVEELQELQTLVRTLYRALEEPGPGGGRT